MSETYTEDNLLDRRTSRAALDVHDAHGKERERTLLDAHLGLRGGDAVSIGAGWHPGRHLLPAPAWRLTAVDADGNAARHAVETGLADASVEGFAGRLDALGDASFDVALYRLVLHHVVYREPLRPVFAEAARLLRPGGAMVAIEPNLWHPVGAGLALANRLGLGTKVHGTPDDVPLSPRVLLREARAAGLEPQLHSTTYAWRRLPPSAQRAMARLDAPLGSRRGARALGHTLLLLARKPR